MKVCCIYNFAQLYREPIFKEIDNFWNCEWWFGKNTTDIKGMNTECLKNVRYVDNRKVIGPFWGQPSIGGRIRDKSITHYLLLGDLFNLSIWWLLLQRRLWYRHKKIILWSHGWYGKEGTVKKYLKRIFFGMADHVLTYGEYGKKVAIEQGFNGDKITPIHNSLNHTEQVKLRNTLHSTDIFIDHFGNPYPTLLFIGRLTAVKHLDLLIDAVSLLKKRNQNFNLVLIGTGEKYGELSNLVKNLGLDKSVWFYGECYDDSKIAQLIYDADLCVAPGNVGLTAMHTMVYGTPVLTHDDFKWQMPEFEAIKIGKTGAFFRRGDVESLADSIQKWIDEHRDRTAVRTACYNEIDTNWTPEYQIEVLKQCLT